MSLLMLFFLTCYNLSMHSDYSTYALLDRDWGIIIINDTSLETILKCQIMQGKITIIFRPKGIAIIDFLTPGYSFEIVPKSHMGVYSDVWNFVDMRIPSIVNIRGTPIYIRFGAFKK